MGDELRFLLLGCRHFDDIPTRRGIGGEVIRHTCFGLTVLVTDLPIDITSTTGANSSNIPPAISKIFFLPCLRLNIQAYFLFTEDSRIWQPYSFQHMTNDAIV